MQVAAAAAKLFAPGETAIVDGGSTALQLVAALPDDHTGTVVTHSPTVAAALERCHGTGRSEPWQPTDRGPARQAD